MKLKVAIIQYDSNEPDIDFNTELAVRYIKEAKDNGADIVLFPECFLSAYCVPDICEELYPIEQIEDDTEFIDWCNRAVTENEEHVLKIRQLAKELNIGVLLRRLQKGNNIPKILPMLLIEMAMLF